MLIGEVVALATQAVFSEENLCRAVVLLEVGLIGLRSIGVVVEQSESNARFMNEAR